MRWYLFFLILLLPATFLRAQGPIQSEVGLGYFGESITHPGIMLEYGLQKPHGDRFSFIHGVDLGYYQNQVLHAGFVELHTGFRQSIGKQLFLEQQLGLGLLISWFQTEDLYYYDDYANAIQVNPSGNKSIAPAVTIGAGYHLSESWDIWCRPKFFWDLGFKGLNTPYFALQIGMSYHLK